MQTIYFHSRRQQYGSFSNFYSSPIIVAGRGFASVEHWYQANKARTAADFDRVRKSSTPEEAKSLGNSIQYREDWSDIQFQVMYRGIMSKFLQHPSLCKILLDTGDCAIHEDSSDPLWGFAGGRGRDFLGKILMQVRAQITQFACSWRDHQVYREIGSSATSGFILASFIRDHGNASGAWAIHGIKQYPNAMTTKTVRRILQSGEILPSPQFKEQGAVCFRIADLRTYTSQVTQTESKLRREDGVLGYSAFAIAWPFSYARELPILPALHATPSSSGSYPATDLFRISLYSPAHHYDWTYENEWRAADKVRLRRDLSLIIVPDSEDGYLIRTAFGHKWNIVTAQQAIGISKLREINPHAYKLDPFQPPLELDWISKYSSAVAEEPPYRFESRGSSEARHLHAPRSE